MATAGQKRDGLELWSDPEDSSDQIRSLQGELTRNANGDGVAIVPNVEYGLLVELTGFWIRRAQLRVFKSFGQYLGQFDLRPVEVATLIIVVNNKEITQNTLAGALATDPSTVVGLLTRLEGRKLVVRKRQASDRRFQQVRLTRTGEALVDRLSRSLIEHNSNVLEHLDLGQQRQLLALLKRTVGQ